MVNRVKVLVATVAVGLLAAAAVGFAIAGSADSSGAARFATSLSLTPAPAYGAYPLAVQNIQMSLDTAAETLDVAMTEAASSGVGPADSAAARLAEVAAGGYQQLAATAAPGSDEQAKTQILSGLAQVRAAAANMAQARRASQLTARNVALESAIATADTPPTGS